MSAALGGRQISIPARVAAAARTVGHRALSTGFSLACLGFLMACRSVAPAAGRPAASSLAEWRAGKRDVAVKAAVQWLRPGLEAREVLATLGPPDRRSEEQWVYEWIGALVQQQPTAKGTRFTVTPVPRTLSLRFAHGILVSVEASAVPRRDAPPVGG